MAEDQEAKPRRVVRDKELIALEKISEAARILYEHHTNDWRIGYGSEAKARAAVSRIMHYADSRFGVQYE